MQNKAMRLEQAGNTHKKAKLDAAGFIRAEENAKRAQTQELDILCYLLYNVYIINIK